jgi:hypothetical protein
MALLPDCRFPSEAMIPLYFLGGARHPFFGKKWVEIYLID